jgi:hypothetical protein
MHARQGEQNDCWMYSKMVDAPSGVRELASGRKNNQIQVRPCLDGPEIIVVDYGYRYSTWAFLRMLHTMFKLRCDFARWPEPHTGTSGVPQRLLDEDASIICSWSSLVS